MEGIETDMESEAGLDANDADVADDEVDNDVQVIEGENEGFGEDCEDVEDDNVESETAEDDNNEPYELEFKDSYELELELEEFKLSTFALILLEFEVCGEFEMSGDPAAASTIPAEYADDKEDKDANVDDVVVAALNKLKVFLIEGLMDPLS
jgi:hypothetical protein